MTDLLLKILQDIMSEVRGSDLDLSYSVASASVSIKERSCLSTALIDCLPKVSK